GNRVAADQDLVDHCADVVEDQLVILAGLQAQRLAFGLTVDLKVHLAHQDADLDGIVVVVAMGEGGAARKQQQKRQQQADRSHGVPSSSYVLCLVGNH